MIGHLQGQVLFSDGKELIVMTSSGVGYELYFGRVYPEGAWISLFTSQVIRENSHELYGLETLRAKKLFELLLTVKNVGAKSAFALLSSLGVESIINAVITEDKGALKKAPGVGDKAASQMILDLSAKIIKIKMYENKKRKVMAGTLSNQSVGESSADFVGASATQWEEDQDFESEVNENSTELLQEALMACLELGFKEEKIIPKAQRILNEHKLVRPEQLVHLVLKEM